MSNFLKFNGSSNTDGMSLKNSYFFYCFYNYFFLVFTSSSKGVGLINLSASCWLIAPVLTNADKTTANTLLFCLLEFVSNIASFDKRVACNGTDVNMLMLLAYVDGA